MIETLWQEHAMAVLLLWAAMVSLWLWGIPRENTRWLDRVYPVLPMAVAALGLSGAWSADFLSTFLQLGIWLWAWLTVVWVISLLKRDASIMDIAYGVLLLGASWWLFLHNGAQAQASNVLLLSMTSIGFGRYSLYILWRNLPHGEDPRYARWRQRSGARWWWWSYFQIFLLQGVVIWIWAVPLVRPGKSAFGTLQARWSGWWASSLKPAAIGN
jgi:steroid 5-alpha reductase family enzyme